MSSFARYLFIIFMETESSRDFSKARMYLKQYSELLFNQELFSLNNYVVTMLWPHAFKSHKIFSKLCNRTIPFISFGDGTNENLREKHDSLNEMWFFNILRLKMCVGSWKLMNLSRMTFFRILLLSRNVEIRYEFFIIEKTKTDLNVLWNANISIGSLFIIIWVS